MNLKNAKKVLVIGAGLAGLAASKELVEAGHKVHLLESRSLIGGKVSAWRDRDGDWVESGLHVFFGSYRKIFDLMRDVGIYQNIDWQEACIPYRLPGGDSFSISSCEFLPSPLNLFGNLPQIRHFSIQDLWNYCKAIIPILAKDRAYIDAQDDITFADWVKRAKLSDEMVQKMFLPMTLSLKFIPPHEISAQVVLNVFRLFVADPKGFKIGFLNGSPQEKLTQPILDYLRARGLSYSLNRKVSDLVLERDEQAKPRIKAVLASGEAFVADHFVFALPCHQFQRILSGHFPGDPYFENLKRFTGAPVMNAQFWLKERITADRRLQFGAAGHTPVFADMSLSCKDYATADGCSMIESVIAPAAGLSELSNQEVLDMAWQEICSYYPHLAGRDLIKKSSLVRLPHSVYAPRPGLEKYRPSQETPIENLFLAGGFTKGHEFFDSMEGAVQSGILAARALLGKIEETSVNEASAELSIS